MVGSHSEKKNDQNQEMGHFTQWQMSFTYIGFLSITKRLCLGAILGVTLKGIHYQKWMKHSIILNFSSKIHFIK